MYNELVQNRMHELRRAMEVDGIDYYLITTSDFHASEYVSDYFKSREYFSGFTGSNGDLLVWAKGAALWTDGRYFLQAASELEGTGIELMKMGEKNVPTVEEFLRKQMLPGQVMGVDGRCIPVSRGEKLAELMDEIDSKACADADNPNKCKLVWDIDYSERLWTDRPAMPCNKAWLLHEDNTGESRGSRLERVRADIKKNKSSFLIVSSLDDIAWLLLIRGNDIAYNPVTLAYAVVTEENVFLYTDINKFDNDSQKELTSDGIVFKPYNMIYSDLKGNESVCKLGKRAMADPDRLSFALYKSLEEGFGRGGIVRGMTPTVIMKAKKTEQEIENERMAHIKDAVAVTKLLYRLDCIIKSNDFAEGKNVPTELDISEMLLKLRKEQDGFLDQSFAPIIATGAHGAIIHYEPDEKSNMPIEKDAFLLMDTGAQYLQGTTDITRTVAMGVPTDKMREHYTAVLCGNLALADAYFPEGTGGTNIDILARKELWRLGLDFRHGTGHGVGYLLNVHEGPQNISRRARNGMLGAAFEHGMITSDEPGVYIEGEYGIRLENMMVCLKKAESEYGSFYGFETLTLVPFDRKSINPALMSRENLELLEKYNQRVYEIISPLLDEAEKDWLALETAPFV